MAIVGISGSPIPNGNTDRITKAILNVVSELGLRPLLHERVPPGDGGVSAGQAMVAAESLVK